MSGLDNPAEFQVCPVLEEISEKIRHGEPVGIMEAMAAVDYQRARRQWVKYNSWKSRLARYVKALFRKDP